MVGLGRGRAGRGPWGSHGEESRRNCKASASRPAVGGWWRPVESQNLNLCRSKELPFSLWITPISNMILNASQTQKSPRAVMVPGFCVGCFYNQEKMQQACQEMSCPVWKRGRRVPFFSLSPTAGASTPKAVETCPAGRRDLSCPRLGQEMGRICHFSYIYIQFEKLFHIQVSRKMPRCTLVYILKSLPVLNLINANI